MNDSTRLAALPDGKGAAEAAQMLFRAAKIAPDVLACDLSNVNMVLHAPGAVLGAAWVEATSGDFTFYVQGMTGGVARVMRALALDPSNASRLVGGSNSGVFISGDRGAHFTPSSSNDTLAIAIDPADPRTIYSGGGGSAKIARSRCS